MSCQDVFFAVLPDHPIESHLNQLKRVKHESPTFFPENSSISFFEEEARCVDPEAGGVVTGSCWKKLVLKRQVQRCGAILSSPKVGDFWFHTKDCPDFASGRCLVAFGLVFFYTKNKTQKGQLFPVWSSWFQTSWPFIALAKHRRPTVPPGSFRKNQRFCALSFCWFHNLQWWKIPPQTTCHMGMFHLQELPWYGHWFMTGSLKKVTHYNPEKIPGCFQK